LLGVLIQTSVEKRGEISRTHRRIVVALTATFGSMMIAGLAAFLLGTAASKLPVVLFVCGLSGTIVFGQMLWRRQTVRPDEIRKVIAHDL
jgi:hypothetical protein